MNDDVMTIWQKTIKKWIKYTPWIWIIWKENEWMSECEKILRKNIYMPYEKWEINGWVDDDG